MALFSTDEKTELKKLYTNARRKIKNKYGFSVHIHAHTLYPDFFNIRIHKSHNIDVEAKPPLPKMNKKQCVKMVIKMCDKLEKSKADQHDKLICDLIEKERNIHIKAKNTQQDNPNRQSQPVRFFKRITKKKKATTRLKINTSTKKRRNLKNKQGIYQCQLCPNAPPYSGPSGLFYHMKNFHKKPTRYYSSKKRRLAQEKQRLLETHAGYNSPSTATSSQKRVKVTHSYNLNQHEITEDQVTKNTAPTTNVSKQTQVTNPSETISKPLSDSSTSRSAWEVSLKLLHWRNTIKNNPATVKSHTQQRRSY